MIKRLLCFLLICLFPATATTAELQHTTATLSEARYELAATTVDNLAMFAGGYPYSNRVDIYNPQTAQWSIESMSIAHHDLAATSVGNLAMFAGGESSSNAHVDVVDIYNADTAQWSTANLSLARSGLAAVTVGDTAIFAGG